MKKTYIAPSVKVNHIKNTSFLCTSMTVNGTKTTDTQFTRRRSVILDDEEEDFE